MRVDDRRQIPATLRDEKLEPTYGKDLQMSSAPTHGVEALTDALARAVLATASDAIIAADRHGIITFWNPGAERIFGHPSGEAVGQSLDLIIPEPLRAAHWRGFSEVIRTGKSRYGGGDLLSVPSIRGDGQRISLEFTIAPMRDAEGRMTGMAAILRDVTSRFQELRTLRRRLAELDQHSGDSAGAERSDGL
jgi:PAS domain S-box-containing protein